MRVVPSILLVVASSNPNQDNVITNDGDDGIVTFNAFGSVAVFLFVCCCCILSMLLFSDVLYISVI